MKDESKEHKMIPYRELFVKWLGDEAMLGYIQDKYPDVFNEAEAWLLNEEGDDERQIYPRYKPLPKEG